MDDEAFLYRVVEFQIKVGKTEELPPTHSFFVRGSTPNRRRLVLYRWIRKRKGL